MLRWFKRAPLGEDLHEPHRGGGTRPRRVLPRDVEFINRETGAFLEALRAKP